MSGVALHVEEISVAYRRPGGSLATVVHQVSLSLARGRVLGLVGESGCGKSTLALACLGETAEGGVITGGSVTVDGLDLLSAPPQIRRSLWGHRLAHVPQNPAASLNPATRIGRQLAQPITMHHRLRGRELRDRTVDLLDRVGLPDPEKALRRYPHEFSGGQQQRIALALAISCDPQVLILDEPTTGLDVTTEARIVALLRAIATDTRAAVLYISHNLALIANLADRLCVMYAGEIVESGTTAEVVRHPRHPYTRALLAALPSAHRRRAVRGLAGRPPEGVVLGECAFSARCEFSRSECVVEHPALQPLPGGREVRCVRHDRLDLSTPAVDGWGVPARPAPALLLEITGLRCQYRKQAEPAVSDLSLAIARGDTVGIVGESGSGKSTLLHAIAGLHRPRAGTIRFRGHDLAPAARHRSSNARRDIQLVFQNPDSSLNPHQRVGEILSRPIHLFRRDITRREEADAVTTALDQVGLAASTAHRYPAELSGGQRQRVAVARAFAARPALLLCDEVTSALDVSVQATVLELIAELAEVLATTVVLVSHDLAVVRTLCRRAMVMRAGQICEDGLTDDLFTAPGHPYTSELIAAIPALPGGTAWSP